jgi:molybdopterin molybdotransferase
MTLTAPDWASARLAAYRAGSKVRPEPVQIALPDADGTTLATPLVTLTDLPAFPTSSVDGYAARGESPWRLVGRILAGQTPQPLEDGTAVEIATGAMVPEGVDHLVRVEHSETPEPGYVTGESRPTRDWRQAGEEASKGEELLPAGTPVTPGVIGLAASCGYENLLVYPPPRTAVLVFGDELLVSGPPREGRVRDSLGPSMPGWLRRLGTLPVPGLSPRGPVQDTLQAHVAAIREALNHADIVCTTGGTMHGPVDHLHPALDAIDAEYVVNTVKVRPGFPMLLARIAAENGVTKWIAGLPGNPQSAVVAMLSLVTPLVAGLTGRGFPESRQVTLGTPVKGRGSDTRLALVRVEPDGYAYPLSHTGSAMLRGVASADGFAVIPPETSGEPGQAVDLLPMPLRAGERP